MILISATVIVILTTTRESQNEKVVFWLSWKKKMAKLLIVMKGSGCMLNSEASGTTTSTPIVPLITGPLQVQLFVTSSETYLKKNFLFYVFAMGDGKLRPYGKRITTAGSGPCWLGKPGRRHWLLVLALTRVASASERSLWNLRPKISGTKLPVGYHFKLMHLNQRNRRQGWTQTLFLLQAHLIWCV